MVHPVGFEPTHLAAPEPESGVYANFTTGASGGKYIKINRPLSTVIRRRSAGAPTRSPLRLSLRGGMRVRAYDFANRIRDFGPASRFDIDFLRCSFRLFPVQASRRRNASCENQVFTTRLTERFYENNCQGPIAPAITAPSAEAVMSRFYPCSGLVARTSYNPYSGVQISIAHSLVLTFGRTLPGRDIVRFRQRRLSPRGCALVSFSSP